MAKSLRVHQIIRIEWVAKAEMLFGTVRMAPKSLLGLIFPNKPKVRNFYVNSPYIVLFDLFFAKPAAKVAHAPFLYALGDQSAALKSCEGEDA